LGSDVSLYAYLLHETKQVHGYCL